MNYLKHIEIDKKILKGVIFDLKKDEDPIPPILSYDEENKVDVYSRFESSSLSNSSQFDNEVCETRRDNSSTNEKQMVLKEIINKEIEESKSPQFKRIKQQVIVEDFNYYIAY